MMDNAARWAGPKPLGVRPPTRIAALIAHWAMRAFMAATITVIGGVLLGAFLGFRIMVVTSGSMAPRFRSGDAVVVRVGGADRVKVGDVITFRTPEEGMTTHRVVGIRVVDGQTWFMTKGDANATADPNLTPQDAVYGTEVLTLPRIGRFLYFALSPRGKLALLGFPLAYLLIQESRVVLGVRRRRRPRSVLLEDEPPQLGTRRGSSAPPRSSDTGTVPFEMNRSRAHATMALVALVTLLALGLGIGLTRTWGQFSSSRGISGNTFITSSCFNPYQSNISNFAFTPNTFTIARGCRVRWTNTVATKHTTTSDSAVWDSGQLANGSSFTFQFNSTGSFPFHCTNHPALMTGTIVVN
jgi:signal peptidase